ncbi:MAG: hypothetical protein ABGZ23_27095 [Fuerstiella sp.]
MWLLVIEEIGTRTVELPFPENPEATMLLVVSEITTSPASVDMVRSSVDPPASATTRSPPKLMDTSTVNVNRRSIPSRIAGTSRRLRIGSADRRRLRLSR